MPSQALRKAARRCGARGARLCGWAVVFVTQFPNPKVPNSRTIFQCYATLRIAAQQEDLRHKETKLQFG